MLSRLRNLVRNLTRKGERDAELDTEVRGYLELLAQEKMSQGMRPDEARRAARIELGGFEQVKEQVRTVRAGASLDSLLQDLRYGVRMLRKTPGFTLSAVLTLALGIGANTAIFSVVETVLLRPLPFKDPARLVDIWQNNPRHGAWQEQTSYPEFLDWRKQTSAFQSMAVYRETQSATLSGIGDPVRLHGAVVSPDFFEVLGANPLQGRAFSPEQDVPGKAAVVTISYDLWRMRFQSDPTVVGRRVTIAEKSYTIVGIMPRGFQFPILAEPIDVWIPLAAYDGSMPTERGAHIYSAFARLRQGVGLEQATSQINAIEKRLTLQYPDTHTPGDGANVSPLLPDLVGGTRDALLILFGAVALVLLIACANVANLILVRAAGRSREFAIRHALGARRVRLVQQLLTESVLLAALGGWMGLLLGYGGIRALANAGPHDIPRLGGARLDGSAFVFTLVTSLLTSVFFGLAPALRTSKDDLGVRLKERRTVGATKNRYHLRDALIAGEIALSLVLLLAAGLLLRTLWRLESVRAGFDPADVLTFSTDLPSGYQDQQTAVFYEELLADLRALPGAEQVSAVFPLPLSGNSIGTGFEIEGRSSDPGSPISADLCVAGRDYFRTMRIALVRGREFLEGDGQDGNWVAVINQAFAKRYFPHEDPLGQRIKPNAETNGTPSQMSKIIGVVADTKVSSLSEEAKLIVFVPVPEFPIGALSVVIRTASSPGVLLSAVRDRVRALEPAALVFRGQTLDQYLSTSLGQPRFNALLLSVFGAVAVVLAVVGLYGGVAYAVSQRRNEIGIRMALGAMPGAVVGLVLGHGLRLALTGAAIGLASALLLTRVMKSLLFEVGTTDPFTFLGVAILMAGVAVVACYPSRPPRNACRPLRRTARGVVGAQEGLREQV
jgi:putative ABC transport system permease protein